MMTVTSSEPFFKNTTKVAFSDPGSIILDFKINMMVRINCTKRKKRRRTPVLCAVIDYLTQNKYERLVKLWNFWDRRIVLFNVLEDSLGQ